MRDIVRRTKDEEARMQAAYDAAEPRIIAALATGHITPLLVVFSVAEDTTPVVVDLPPRFDLCAVRSLYHEHAKRGWSLMLLAEAFPGGGQGCRRVLGAHIEGTPGNPPFQLCCVIRDGKPDETFHMHGPAPALLETVH